jgi:hypothetical protein
MHLRPTNDSDSEAHLRRDRRLSDAALNAGGQWERE